MIESATQNVASLVEMPENHNGISMDEELVETDQEAQDQRMI